MTQTLNKASYIQYLFYLHKNPMSQGHILLTRNLSLRFNTITGADTIGCQYSYLYSNFLLAHLHDRGFKHQKFSLLPPLHASGIHVTQFHPVKCKGSLLEALRKVQNCILKETKSRHYPYFFVHICNVEVTLPGGKTLNAAVAAKCTTRKAAPVVMRQTDLQTKMLEPHRELNKSKTYREKPGERGVQMTPQVLCQDMMLTYPLPLPLSLHAKRVCYRVVGKQGVSTEKRCLEPTSVSQLQRYSGTPDYSITHQ